MNLDKLNELVSIPKKTDVSKSIRKEYKSEISTLLKEEGFSINAEKYLWAGFSFCGAEPLFDYLVAHTTEEQLNILDAMFRTNTFVKNEKSNAFKMCISLLVYELNYASSNHEVIEMLIKGCAWKYKKKDGSISKDNIKTVEKYFVAVLSPKVSFPEWSSFTIKPSIIKEFCIYLLSVCSEIKNDKLQLQVQGIINWLNNYALDENKDAADKAIIKEKVATTNTLSVPKEDGYDSTAVRQNKEVGRTLSKSSEVSLVAVATQLKEISNQIIFEAEENAKMKKAIFAFEAEKEELTTKLHTAEGLIGKQQKTIAQLMSELLAKDTEINDHKSEIERLKTVISVYSEDKQSSLDGQLNAIASKLKTEYAEFKDALELEMTAEIGEILRDQLMQVFKILLKAGIDIESR